MPLYEMTPDAFRPLSQASFADLKVRERNDLQRLLRSQIEVLGDDLYVLTEEFSDWDDSRRRVDLLAIDLQANLVVIELKRTNDGGHMELQAIRYASMVSAMTFERAEQIHGEFLSRMGEPAQDARPRMLTFLGWEEPDEENFAPDVRIVLVSEDFGKELTTAVLWLRERDIDIRCIRLRPYQEGETLLIDVQQIIPLPEANEYHVWRDVGMGTPRRQACQSDQARHRLRPFPMDLDCSVFSAIQSVSSQRLHFLACPTSGFKLRRSTSICWCAHGGFLIAISSGERGVTSHTFTVRSCVADARRFPSGLNARAKLLLNPRGPGPAPTCHFNVSAASSRSATSGARDSTADVATGLTFCTTPRRSATFFSKDTGLGTSFPSARLGTDTVIFTFPSTPPSGNLAELDRLTAWEIWIFVTAGWPSEPVISGMFQRL